MLTPAGPRIRTSVMSPVAKLTLTDGGDEIAAQHRSAKYGARSQISLIAFPRASARYR